MTGIIRKSGKNYVSPEIYTIEQRIHTYIRCKIFNVAKITDFSRFLQKIVIFGKFKILYQKYHLFNRCVNFRRFIIFTALSNGISQFCLKSHRKKLFL